MDRCSSCITDRNLCRSCRENPIYKDIPKHSLFQRYKRYCPHGTEDCIHDPGYILYVHPDWYHKMYGDKSPEEVAKENCSGECYYDDEDK